MFVIDREERRLVRAADRDERADIGRTAGHDAVERGGDALERFHGLQPLHIGAAGGDLGDIGLQGAVFVIGILLRDRILRQQGVPALRRGGGEMRIGDRGFEIGLRLRQLLVEIRGLDQRQHLSGLHRRADIGVPVLQIAADLGVDRRLVKGADVARQHEVAGRRRQTG